MYVPIGHYEHPGAIVTHENFSFRLSSPSTSILHQTVKNTKPDLPTVLFGTDISTPHPYYHKSTDNIEYASVSLLSIIRDLNTRNKESTVLPIRRTPDFFSSMYLINTRKLFAGFTPFITTRSHKAPP